MKRFLGKIIVAIITLEAIVVLKKYKPNIIAITGSVGKTSAKDIIYAAMENSFYTRKSQKSFNSEFGVPLTILGCNTGWRNPISWAKNIFEGLKLIVLPNHYPKWLILEVGTDKPGDIRAITKWLKPSIVVITSLPDVPVHVENFPNPKDIVKEKKALADALLVDGTLIVNGDDKLSKRLSEEFSNKYFVLTYGMEAYNDIFASHIEIDYKEQGKPSGVNFRVNEKGSSVPTKIVGRIGHQQVFPVIAAFSVAKAVGIPPLRAAQSIAKECGSPGRMRTLDGYNNSTIIDDSYNSSPIALRAALGTMKKIKTTGKKIAVLGDMLELGRFSLKEHKKIGIQVSGIVDILITVGARAKIIAQGAIENGMEKSKIYEFDTGDAVRAGLKAREFIEEKDVILVKGSQSGIRLEKAVRVLIKDSSRASSLLVRQERSWLKTE